MRIIYNVVDRPTTVCHVTIHGACLQKKASVTQGMSQSGGPHIPGDMPHQLRMKHAISAAPYTSATTQRIAANEVRAWQMDENEPLGKL
jgi:hypothetical protein